MRDWIDALRAAWRAAVREYRTHRYLQVGWRNPDEVPF